MKTWVRSLTIVYLLNLPTVNAVDIDEEMEPKPQTQSVAKPKRAQKTEAEREVERLKRELAEERREREALKEEILADRHRQQQTINSQPPSNSLVIDMVRLPSGIAMGKYEVTQAQWRAVMGNNPSNFANCGDNCPVEQVSWEDVQQFIQRLNSQTGKRYRLPSEDEWFAACQAGYGHEYCGSNSVDAVAWYGGNSGNRTHPVGQKQPNAWGLYDMSGNVREWTSSCDEGDCSRRVLRGGFWYVRPADVRSAYRYWNAPSNRDGFLGFRLAQDP